MITSHDRCCTKVDRHGNRQLVIAVGFTSDSIMYRLPADETIHYHPHGSKTEKIFSHMSPNIDKQISAWLNG